MDKAIAANTLGTMGAICWSVQLIPQVIINYRRHNAIGLQPTMMMLWAWAGVPLGVYNIAQNFSVALQIQPQILTFLSLLTWAQCLYYERGWSFGRLLAVATPVVGLMGGTQASLLIAIRYAQQRRLQWPLLLMAAFSAFLLAAGVLRHYIDIYIYRSVRGISFIFISLDAAGDVFSLLSIAFEPSLDILGMVIYSTELLLWIGIFICGACYNARPWLCKRRNGLSSHDQTLQVGVSSTRDEAARNSTVSMHDLPSSTSVFRTTSGFTGARRRSTSLRSGSANADGSV